MLSNVRNSDQWKWVERYVGLENFHVSNEDVLNAYKFYQSSCDSAKVHPSVNCKTNIACIAKLGEKKLVLPTEEGTASSVKKRKQNESDNKIRDPSTEPVGLHNMGATCYINCFLQLFYYDVGLRKVLFSLSVLTQKRDEIVKRFKCQFPGIGQKIDIIIELRKLFALMMKSLKPTLDPTPFLHTLGVSVTDQQDASEFCQLLLFQTLEEPVLHVVNSFEDTFSQPSGDRVFIDQHGTTTNLFMRQRFYGSLKEERVCLHCLSLTQSSSIFTHLSLNINATTKSLRSCLDSFLEEELLDGNNSVFCQQCQMNREKTRSTKLVELPKVLYIHLMRFQWTNGGRIKSKQTISIPKLFDFSPYISVNKVIESQGRLVDVVKNRAQASFRSGNNKYHLCGAIFHIGSSSTCGHYVTSIKTSKNGPWKDFNDAQVKVSTNTKSSNSATTSNANNKSTTGRSSKAKQLKLNNSSNGGNRSDAVPSSSSSQVTANQQPSFNSSDAYVLVYVNESYLDDYFCQSSTTSASNSTSKNDTSSTTKISGQASQITGVDFLSQLKSTFQTTDLPPSNIQERSPTDTPTHQYSISSQCEIVNLVEGDSGVQNDRVNQSKPQTSSLLPQTTHASKYPSNTTCVNIVTGATNSSSEAKGDVYKDGKKDVADDVTKMYSFISDPNQEEGEVKRQPVANHLPLPEDLQLYVDEKNSEYVAEINLSKEKRVKDKQDELDSAIYVSGFLNKMPSDNPYDNNHAYVPTAWIRKFIQNPSGICEFSQTSLDEMTKCAHGKLSVKPTTLHNVKRISIRAAQVLSEVNNLTFPTKEDLCVKCVQEAAEDYVLEQRLKEEWKVVSKYLTSSVLNSNIELVLKVLEARRKKLIEIKTNDYINTGVKMLRSDAGVCGSSRRLRVRHVLRLTRSGQFELIPLKENEEDGDDDKIVTIESSSTDCVSVYDLNPSSVVSLHPTTTSVPAPKLNDVKTNNSDRNEKGVVCGGGSSQAVDMRTSCDVVRLSSSSDSSLMESIVVVDPTESSTHTKHENNSNSLMIKCGSSANASGGNEIRSQKQIDNEQCVTDDPCYVVSRQMLKDWRRLRKNNARINTQNANEGDCKNVGNNENRVDPRGDGAEEEVSDSSLVATEMGFASSSLTRDIFCIHDKIDPDEKLWAVVGQDVWYLIERHFPATDKLQPMLNINSFNDRPSSTANTFGEDDDELIFEKCRECIEQAQQDATLSHNVKVKLKPYEQALKNLQKLESFSRTPKWVSSIDTDRLYVIPHGFIQDMRDLIKDLKHDSGLFENWNKTSLLNVDYSHFYCNCSSNNADPRRCVPLHVSPGAVTSVDEIALIEGSKWDYFVIPQVHFVLLTSLNISFPTNVIYFDQLDSCFEDQDKENVLSELSSLSSTESLLDNGGVNCSDSALKFSWKINVPLCENCFELLKEQHKREKFNYQDKLIYFVPKFRLETLKNYSTMPSAPPVGASTTGSFSYSYSRGTTLSGGYGGRKISLYGSLRLSVNSTDTVFQVKRNLAARVHKFASSLQLYKYDPIINNILVLTEEDATLEACQIQAGDYLLWEEELTANPLISPLQPDTNADYRESGFSGSNLLSSATVAFNAAANNNPNIASNTLNSITEDDAMSSSPDMDNGAGCNETDASNYCDFTQ